MIAKILPFDGKKNCHHAWGKPLLNRAGPLQHCINCNAKGVKILKAVEGES